MGSGRFPDARDTTYPLDAASVDKVERGDLFDDWAEEVNLAAS